MTTLTTLFSLVNDRRVVRSYALAALVASVLRAAVLLTLLWLVTELLSGSPGDAWGWLAAFLLVTAANWWAEKRLVQLGFDVGFDLLGGLETRLHDRLDRARPDWYDDLRRADVQRAITTAGQELCSSVAYVLTPAVSAVSSTLLVGIGLLWVHPVLGGTAIVAWVLAGSALLLGGRLLRSADAAYDEASNDAGARIVEFARSQQVLRAARQAGSAQSALGGALARQRRAAISLITRTVPGSLLFTIVHLGALVALTACAVALLARGELTAAECVALVVVLVRFLEPFDQLADLAPALELIRGGVERVRASLQAPILPEPASRTAEADRSGPSRQTGQPALELRDVRFAWPGGPAVLDGIDLVVPRGTTTAIVGPSGSGKSTLLDLVARVADVGNGAVLVDGIDVREMTLDDLLGQIASVHQDVYLFDGTLRDNIRAGRPGSTDDDLRTAASAAQLDDVIERLPDGWDTRIGEDGELLSGGERQRVGIARAIARHAPLLLLDEATSALDLRTERGLVAALEERTGDATVLVVAHRLSTIARADSIAFLEGGRIVEQGTLDELLAADGRFADYWRLREASAAWNLV